MDLSIQAWECIGGGRIEAPQNCIGICQDRRVQWMDASEHRTVEPALATAGRERDAMLYLVRMLAFSRLRNAEWGRSYRALQAPVILTTLGSESAGR